GGRAPACFARGPGGGSAMPRSTPRRACYAERRNEPRGAAANAAPFSAPPRVEGGGDETRGRGRAGGRARRAVAAGRGDGDAGAPRLPSRAGPARPPLPARAGCGYRRATHRAARPLFLPPLPAWSDPTPGRLRTGRGDALSHRC